jgi:nitrogen fixation protein NifU and related proteins
MYTPTVLDHFKNPRNVGEITDADGVGEVGNPVCGDMINVYLKVKDDVIEDIKFKTFGCGAAIAVSSMLTELAKGKTLDQAMKISNTDVAKALEGLPKNKLHCSNLGADALHAAIKNYRDRQANKDVLSGAGEKVPHHPEKIDACYCPYCDMENKGKSEFCVSCGADLPHEH